MLNFIYPADIPPNAITLDNIHAYNGWLIVLSYGLAILGSFIAILILRALNGLTGIVKATGIVLGSASMATAVCSMHYTGMLSYDMTMDHHYNFSLVFLSGLISFGFALGIFLILSRRSLSWPLIVLCAPVLGMGALAVHHVGMAAMEMKANMYFKPVHFWLSVVLSVFASAVGLWIMDRAANSKIQSLRLNAISAIVIGIGVTGIHSISMAGTVFIPYADCRFIQNHNHTSYALAVAFSACLIIGLSSAFLLYTRNLSSNRTAEKELRFLTKLKIASLSLVLCIIAASGFFAYKINNSLLLITAANYTNENISNHAKAEFLESESSANIMLFLIFPGIALFAISAIAYNQSLSLMRFAINERKFTQDILDTVSDPIFVKDKDHIWRAGNKAFWNLMGGAAENYLGKSDHDIFPPEEVAIFWERDNWVINTGITDINEEKVTGADGKTMVCITTKAPLMLGDGKKGLVGVIHDITKLKSAEIELERHKTNLEKMVAEQTAIIVQERENIKIAKDIAEAASNAKSDFLANISHELRTPLNSIMGMADLMKNTSLNTDQRDMLDAVSDSSENLLDIVNDLLDLSKIESGHVDLENIPFNPSQNIRKVFNMLVPAASKKGIMLFYHASDNEKQVLLKGDPLRFSRIATNLIGNAIKYTDAGKVDICLATIPVPGNRVRLSLDVVDTGIGIAQDKIAVIFDKFVQADSSTTRKYGGSGLGLAITKQLVEMMGGAINVESIIGKGSRFSVYIPFEICSANDADQAEEVKIFSSVGTISVSEAKILVAEDHLLNQVYIKKLLPTIGLNNFTIVENGQSALMKLKEEKFHIVLMDCHMPIMNGYDATKAIREHEQKTGGSVAIIAMTANAMMGEREKCLACGMDEYMSKPISRERLVELLSHWIKFDKKDDSNKGKKNEKEKRAQPEPNVTNLDTIRKFSDANQGLERELAAIFVQQTKMHLKTMQDCCIDGVCPEWKSTAHILKGGSAILGAMNMRNLCAKAQGMIDSTARERTEILAQIEKEYIQVCAELEKKGLVEAGGRKSSAS